MNHHTVTNVLHLPGLHTERPRYHICMFGVHLICIILVARAVVKTIMDALIDAVMMVAWRENGIVWAHSAVVQTHDCLAFVGESPLESFDCAALFHIHSSYGA